MGIKSETIISSYTDQNNNNNNKYTVVRIATDGKYNALLSKNCPNNPASF
jgi:hypothetical protein